MATWLYQMQPNNPEIWGGGVTPERVRVRLERLCKRRRPVAWPTGWQYRRDLHPGDRLLLYLGPSVGNPGIYGVGLVIENHTRARTVALRFLREETRRLSRYPFPLLSYPLLCKRVLQGWRRKTLFPVSPTSARVLTQALSRWMRTRHRPPGQRSRATITCR